MPVYEYQCQKCKKIEEKVHPASSHPKKKKCIHCGGIAIKIFRPAAVIFKGSGFYVTDSRKKEAAPERKEKPAEGKKSPQEEKSSEKKAS